MTATAKVPSDDMVTARGVLFPLMALLPFLTDRIGSREARASGQLSTLMQSIGDAAASAAPTVCRIMNEGRHGGSARWASDLLENVLTIHALALAVAQEAAPAGVDDAVGWQANAALHVIDEIHAILTHRDQPAGDT